MKRMYIVAGVLATCLLIFISYKATFGKPFNIATHNASIVHTREEATEVEQCTLEKQKHVVEPYNDLHLVSRGTPRRKTEVFTLTAYCSCKQCSGKWGNNTAIGVKAKEGRTIAVDPDVIDLGTVVRIDNLGVYMAEDTGGKIKGNRIDVYFENHEEAVNFGVQERRVTYDVGR